MHTGVPCSLVGKHRTHDNDEIKPPSNSSIDVQNPGKAIALHLRAVQKGTRFCTHLLTWVMSISILKCVLAREDYNYSLVLAELATMPTVEIMVKIEESFTASRSVNHSICGGPILRMWGEQSPRLKLWSSINMLLHKFDCNCRKFCRYSCLKFSCRLNDGEAYSRVLKRVWSKVFSLLLPQRISKLLHLG